MSATERRFSMEEIVACFYVKGASSIVDAVNPDTGRGLYGGRTLAEVQVSDPGAELRDLDEASREIESLYLSGPTEITKDAYWYALEVLPPVRWHTGTGAESFEMSERMCGRVTSLYCRIGTRYFTYLGFVRTPHAEIVAKCRAFMESADAAL